MGKIGSYDIGTLLGLAIGVALVMSRNTVVVIIGIVWLVWRFGLGGIDGGAPGASVLDKYIPAG